MTCRATRDARGRTAPGKATSRAGQCLKTGPGTNQVALPHRQPQRPAASSRHSLGRQPQPGQDRTGDGIQNRVHPCPGRAGDVDRTVIDK